MAKNKTCASDLLGSNRYAAPDAATDGTYSAPVRDPELKRDGATRYLGHFANPKHLNRGHNDADCPKMPEENDEAHAKRCAKEKLAKAGEAVRKSFQGNLGKKTFGL